MEAAQKTYDGRRLPIYDIYYRPTSRIHLIQPPRVNQTSLSEAGVLKIFETRSPFIKQTKFVPSSIISTKLKRYHIKKSNSIEQQSIEQNKNNYVLLIRSKLTVLFMTLQQMTHLRSASQSNLFLCFVFTPRKKSRFCTCNLMKMERVYVQLHYMHNVCLKIS